MPVCKKSVVIAIELRQSFTLVRQRIWKVRVNRQSAVEVADRLAITLQAVQHSSPAIPGLRHGVVDMECPTELLERFIGPLQGGKNKAMIVKGCCGRPVLAQGHPHIAVGLV